MLNWLIGLFASVSTVFTNGANKSNVTPPLNTAIIAYQETYYVPVVADLGNFPWAKKISEAQTLTAKSILIKPVIPSLPPATPPPSLLPLTPLPQIEPEDPYLVKTEPICRLAQYEFDFGGQ